MKIINPKLKTESGFTLVEILITIFIFNLALTAVVFILTTNDRNAEIIRNDFVASGLAQEGLEVVRNIRDHDWFLDNPPGTQPFGSSIPDGTYRVQWDSQALIPLGANPFLKKDSSTGLFSYGTGTDTLFKRSITISTAVANVEKIVTVNVSWNERGSLTKSVNAEEHLFNWK